MVDHNSDLRQIITPIRCGTYNYIKCIIKIQINRQSALSPDVSLGYFSWFAEGKTVEMFQPQSCKSWTIEEQMLLPHLLPYNLNNLRPTKFLALQHVCMNERTMSSMSSYDCDKINFSKGKLYRRSSNFYFRSEGLFSRFRFGNFDIKNWMSRGNCRAAPLCVPHFGQLEAKDCTAWSI